MAGSCNLQKDNQRLTLPLAERIQKYLEYTESDDLRYFNSNFIDSSITRHFHKTARKFSRNEQSVHRL